MENHRRDSRQRSWSAEERVLLARAACLCFGLGLIFWALAPAIVSRVLTGEPPTFEMLALQSGSMLLSAAFVGFYALLRRHLLWVVWAAFLLSCTIFGAGFAVAATGGVQASSLFLILLSAATSVATWCAIEPVSRLRHHGERGSTPMFAPTDDGSEST